MQTWKSEKLGTLIYIIPIQVVELFTVSVVLKLNSMTYHYLGKTMLNGKVLSIYKYITQ